MLLLAYFASKSNIMFDKVEVKNLLPWFFLEKTQPRKIQS